MSGKKITDWTKEQNNFRQRVATRELQPSECFSDLSGTTLLVVSSLGETDSEFESSPYLMMSMALGRAGKMRKTGDWGTVEGSFRPCTLAVTLPKTRAVGFTPKARMLGIAVSADKVDSIVSDFGGREALLPAVSKLHNDQLCTSVLTALWQDALVHGLSSAFFDHGLDLILRRLTTQHSKLPSPRAVKPLSSKQLQKALDLIESRIDSDLRVHEIADLLGRDRRNLTRAFRDSTGYAPYEYLTNRRMERAKELLSTKCSILDIAMMVGYSNPAKFSAAFHRIYGCNPSTWRKDFAQ